MPSLSPRSLLCIIPLSLLCRTVLSRHIHGHAMHRHRHHVRPIAASALPTTAQPSTTSENPPAVTEGDAVISEIQEIQNGLSDLPTDIVKFIMALQQRLNEVESMLSSLLTGSPEPTSAVPTIATGTRDNPPSSIYATSTANINTLCHPPSGAGPLIPCPVSTFAPTGTAASVYASYASASYLNISGPSWYSAWYWSNHRSSTAMAPTTLNTIAIPSPMWTAPTPPTPWSPPPTSSAYTFNAADDNNVAVYFDVDPNAQLGGLYTLCENPNVDITILAFLSDFSSQGGYPIISFGPGCSGPNEAQAAKAPGLKDCTDLAPEISGCQALGKKVLLSLGGWGANSSFTSDSEAAAFADMLWNLFGAGTGDDPSLRPFGTSVKVDGFDIDNESYHPDYYGTFASALRAKYDGDPSKTYYLSAAPQCPMPDASIPYDVMAQADFVWVQFYNNPSCNLDSAGFEDSFAAWSANLTSSYAGGPRVYIGAMGFGGSGSGYVEGSGLSVPVSGARGLGTSNLGGMMVWDGSRALANMDQYGQNYLEYAKAALQG